MTALIRENLAAGSIECKTLEKVVGKCRSMAIAVPCAILYMWAQYAALQSYFNDRARGIHIPRRRIRLEGKLLEELLLWLDLVSDLINGAS